MDLEWLQSFRIFADTLNFTHAATQRNLSQPALFRHIQNLSEDLGVPLYGKVGRNIHLTEAGIRLARFAREIPDRVSEVYREVRSDSQNPAVALSAGQGAFLYLLGPAIRGFMGQGGKVRLQVRDRDQSLADLREGRAHFAVTVLNDPPTDLSARVIHEVTPQLIVPQDHALAQRKSIALRSLDGLPLVLPSPGKPMRTALENRFSDEGLVLNAVLAADGWELMMHFVSLGLGFAIVNGCCAPPHGTRPIRILGLPKTRYSLVQVKEGFRFPAMQNFKTLLVKETKKVQLFHS